MHLPAFGFLCTYPERKCLPSMSSLFCQNVGSLLFYDVRGTDIEKQQNISYKSWIKKTCHKLIIPWLLALTFYLLEGVCFQLLHTGQIDFSVEMSSLAKLGHPTRGWHLWFMYAFVEVYLLVPLLIMLKRKSQIVFYITGIVLFIRPFLFDISLPWYLKFINYLALFILGDFIHNYCSHLNRMAKYSLAGVFSLLLSLQSHNIYMDFFDGSQIAFIENIGPMRIMRITSVLCMIIFSNLKMQFSTYTLTRYFLPIYLLHIFAGDVWSGILRILHCSTLNTWWIIFVDCFAIFIGCYMLCISGDWLQNSAIKLRNKIHLKR